MLIQPEEGGKDSYDRFRGRLMIPIRDARGRVIAFGGRILGDGEPKYLNSPDTPLFDKGRTLYNLDRAGPASRTAKRLIVVEGYMDVIALDRAGIAEVVAPNGTAVTEAQLERMWRLDPAPILCFDGDSAGRKAAIRAALRALPHLGPDRTLRFVELPAGQDPDDVVRAGGRDAFEALLAKPEPLDERLWRHELEAAPLDHARGPRRPPPAPDRPRQAIGDPALRRLYRDQWLDRFDTRDRAASAAPAPSPAPPVPAPASGRFAPPDPPGQRHRAGDRRRRHRPRHRPRADPRLRQFPRGAARPLRAARRACPSPTPRTARLRDQLVNAAFSGAALDRDGLATILESAGAGADLKAARSTGGMGFSFTRRDADPERAVRDLGGGDRDACRPTARSDAALAEATERLKAGRRSRRSRSSSGCIVGAREGQGTAGVARRHRLSGAVKIKAHGEERTPPKPRPATAAMRR